MPVQAGLGYKHIEGRFLPPHPFPPLLSTVLGTQGLPPGLLRLGLTCLPVCHLCPGGLSAASPLLTLRLAETCSW